MGGPKDGGGWEGCAQGATGFRTATDVSPPHPRTHSRAVRPRRPLEFTNEQYAIIGAIGVVATIVSVYIYDTCFRTSNVRAAAVRVVDISPALGSGDEG